LFNLFRDGWRIRIQTGLWEADFAVGRQERDAI